MKARIEDRNNKIINDAKTMTSKELAEKYEVSLGVVKVLLSSRKVKAVRVFKQKRTHCKCGQPVHKSAMCHECYKSYYRKYYSKRRSTPRLRFRKRKPEPITDPQFLALKEKINKSLAEDKYMMGLLANGWDFETYTNVQPKHRYSRL